ncbi:MAG: gliding motility-associated ABC transporter substrate-binding protein GldG [Bacteroidota bacterium]|nr:gliding motility-associated ABC transporter substrate-binding protein GldG [Bacteroidota bacterium]
MADKKKSLKRTNITQLILGLVILLLVNVISYYAFTRVDLTAEKRYSLSPATKKLLRNLNDVVFFKVYLEGDLPPGFRRLSNETREMLDVFRAYSKNIEYEFVDPSTNTSAKDRNDAYRLLVERGLQPTELRVNKKGESTQQIIFPGIIVSYRGHEAPVQLLMTQLGQPPEKVLNNSIQSLEYNLASAIQKLTQVIKPQIAFIEGQGELNNMQTADITVSLSQFYNVDRVTLDHKINSLTVRLKSDSLHDKLVNKYRAIIIAKPLQKFDEKDKFLIDQFIMRGGKVLWLLDPVFASMDSLQKYSNTMGISNDVNLDDMLFNYGVRLNNNLVMDLSALPIPVKTGQIGNQPRFEFFPWYFFPLITPSISHPIVNGINALKTEFVSSVDTADVPGVKKTFLLSSSPYSRTVSVPVLIDLDILRHPPDEKEFNMGPQPIAILLEGSFKSAFQYRIPPEIANNKELGYYPESHKPTKMIIVADGDVIKNQFHYSQGYYLPLGYDQYTRETYGNKDFIMNAVNYLCDDSGLISVRSRELSLRLLDMVKVNKERIFWQFLNIIIPLILILGFGLVKSRLRKNKYTRITQKGTKA